MTRGLSAALFVSGLTACDRLKGADAGVNDVVGTLNRTAKDIGSSVEPYTAKVTTLAGDEIRKLYKVEYKVVDLESSIPSLELEGKLGQLGDERWECAVQQLDDKIRLICKRLPISYLKLLPHVF